MPTYPLYPLKLQPALHVKVWGGRMLEEALNKRLPSADPYGESWELHDSVSVTNGPLRGTTLGELTLRYGTALIGDRQRLVRGLSAFGEVHPRESMAVDTSASQTTGRRANSRAIRGARPKPG